MNSAREQDTEICRISSAMKYQKEEVKKKKKKSHLKSHKK